MKKKKPTTKKEPAAAPASPPASSWTPPPQAASPSSFSNPLRSLVIDERLFVTVVVVAVAALFLWQVRDVLVPLLFVGVVT